MSRDSASACGPPVPAEHGWSRLVEVRSVAMAVDSPAVVFQVFRADEEDLTTNLLHSAEYYRRPLR